VFVVLVQASLPARLLAAALSHGLTR